MLANGKGNFLDDTLTGFEIVKSDPTVVLYQQFLLQLHLPAEKIGYHTVLNGNKIMVTPYLSEMELLDELQLKNLDHKLFTAPSSLYTFYLLQQYLGLSSFSDKLGVIHDKKSRLLYLHSSFEVNSIKEKPFKQNQLYHWLIKNVPKKALQLKHDSFFVLLDNKFKNKLINALIVFQSETGKTVEKDKVMAIVLNKERLTKLAQWSHKLVY